MLKSVSNKYFLNVCRTDRGMFMDYSLPLAGGTTRMLTNYKEIVSFVSKRMEGCPDVEIRSNGERIPKAIEEDAAKIPFPELNELKEMLSRENSAARFYIETGECAPEAQPNKKQM